jgi:D-alanine-D-alanine ligase-like ATP-grasp enzyme
MDLSVIHDNRQAKALYRKLGFEAVQYFAVKIKNAHNEALFLGPELEQKLNPYARIIVDEARSRGISVKVLDIERQSRRRRAATGGESEIPIDGETRSCLAEQDYTLKDVIPSGESVVVRKTANLHTGGTLHDVTDCLHPSLIDVSRQIAQRLEIPVVGLDFIVTAAEKREYVIIEANERPGLANHEPQPTAQRFVDLLFPLSISAAEREPRSTQSE